MTHRNLCIRADGREDSTVLMVGQFVLVVHGDSLRTDWLVNGLLTGESSRLRVGRRRQQSLCREQKGKVSCFLRPKTHPRLRRLAAFHLEGRDDGRVPFQLCSFWCRTQPRQAVARTLRRHQWATDVVESILRLAPFASSIQAFVSRPFGMTHSSRVLCD